MPKIVSLNEEIEIPKGVTATLNGKILTTKGAKGSVVKDFTHAKHVEISQHDGKIFLSTEFPRKATKALMGTLRNRIVNMFQGVLLGYEYRMKICFAHFPITVEVPKSGTEILIKNFQGERSARVTHMAPNVKVTSTKEDVIVNGPDKDTVGETCANIQRTGRIRFKDRRIFQDGIYIFKKNLGDKILWELK